MYIPKFCYICYVECTKKKLRKSDAKSILAYNRKNHSDSRWRREIRYYHCPKCNMWHLTSISENPHDKLDIKINKEMWEEFFKKQE